MKQQDLDKLIADRVGHVPVVLATNLDSGDQAFYHQAELDTKITDDTLRGAVQDAFRTDRGGVVEVAGERIFLNVFNPPMRLIIVGAVHITQALIPMATVAGFRVSVIDPRRAFANAERFPDVALSNDWPDEALADWGLDSRCALVTLTHDPKIDDPALETALKTNVAYIGALGSNKTHAARTDRLHKAGFGDADIARIHGPIGLDIGAKSPAEIAVSILAEIIQAFRRG